MAVGCYFWQMDNLTKAGYCNYFYGYTETLWLQIGCLYILVCRV